MKMLQPITSQRGIFLFILLFLTWCKVGLQSDNETRYIFYDVNPGEGFNLRRDVFMRVAVFVKKLNQAAEGTSFILVLPPWYHLYHWQSRELQRQSKIPWKSFFDVESINRYVPVLELEEYIELEGPHIDAVYYLQGYKEGWTDGKFEEKFDLRDCLEAARYFKDDATGVYAGRFWDFDEMTTKEFACLSVQGSTTVLKDFVLKDGRKSLMLDRAENLLHDWFGDEDYWSVRRSMRFAKQLVAVADDFRARKFGSDDVNDKTEAADRWEDFVPERGSPLGGPYICAHIRRKDYVHSRKDNIPTIKGAAEQLQKKMKEHDLTSAFVSSDMPDEEMDELYRRMPSKHIRRFRPRDEQLRKYLDGGVAIIDQSICSHARYFLGSYESTFTFRIQEEREIMGFPVEQTFDLLCPEGQFNCSRGSVWKITYPKQHLNGRKTEL